MYCREIPTSEGSLSINVLYIYMHICTQYTCAVSWEEYIHGAMTPGKFWDSSSHHGSCLLKYQYPAGYCLYWYFHIYNVLSDIAKNTRLKQIFYPISNYVSILNFSSISNCSSISGCSNIANIQYLWCLFVYSLHPSIPSSEIMTFKGTGTRDLIWLKVVSLERSWWVGLTEDL